MPETLDNSHLEENIDQDDEDGEGEVEEEPDLHRLDVGGAGQAGGDREVDRGQDHHAGDVDGVDQAVLVLSCDVVGGLVDDVHQDGGQVGHHEDTEKFSGQNQSDYDYLPHDFI